jgi:hypothetical protein
MSSEFPYFANATLDDGEEVVVDLEQRGWADKEILARTVRWTLVPKGTHITLRGQQWPLVQIVYVGMIRARSSDQIERKVIPVLTVPRFRSFCIGWKKGRQTVWTWVHPDGSIETGTGDDSYLGDALRAHLNTQVREVPEPEPEAQPAT